MPVLRAAPAEKITVQAAVGGQHRTVKFALLGPLAVLIRQPRFAVAILNFTVPPAPRRTHTQRQSSRYRSRPHGSQDHDKRYGLLFDHCCTRCHDALLCHGLCSVGPCTATAQQYLYRNKSLASDVGGVTCQSSTAAESHPCSRGRCGPRWCRCEAGDGCSPHLRGLCFWNRLKGAD